MKEAEAVTVVSGLTGSAISMMMKVLASQRRPLENHIGGDDGANEGRLRETFRLGWTTDDGSVSV